MNLTPFFYASTRYISTTANMFSYAEYGSFNLSYGKALDGSGTLMFDLSRYSTKLAKGSRWIGQAGLAVEALEVFGKGKDRTADDWGHLAMNSTMTYVSEKGGVWGALAGAIWTVSDTYVQTQHYSPQFEGTGFLSSYTANSDVQGWSVYRAMRNDSDAWGGLQLMKVHPEYKLDFKQAVDLYRTQEMIRKYERVHD